MGLLLQRLNLSFISIYALRKASLRRYMASNVSVSQLPSQLRDLVLAAAPRDEDFGASDKDRAEVSDWISKVANGDIVQPSTAKVCSFALPSFAVFQPRILL